MLDQIEFVVFADTGEVRLETGEFSEALHSTADDLIRQLEELLAGESTVTQKEGEHEHVHVFEGQRIVHRH